MVCVRPPARPRARSRLQTPAPVGPSSSPTAGEAGEDDGLSNEDDGVPGEAGEEDGVSGEAGEEDGVSKYEEERLANIRRNHEFLRNLGIEEPKVPTRGKRAPAALGGSGQETVRASKKMRTRSTGQEVNIGGRYLARYMTTRNWFACVVVGQRVSFSR
jgi:hypothetical protein